MNVITNLRDETRDLLRCRPATLAVADIARAIGTSTAWVNSFARGDIENPGVNTVETLNHFLRAELTKARKL